MSDTVPGTGPSLMMRILNITCIVLFYVFATLAVVCLIGIVWPGWRDFAYSVPFVYFSLEDISGEGLQAVFMRAAIIYIVLLVIVILVKKYVVDKRMSAVPSA